MIKMNFDFSKLKFKKDIPIMNALINSLISGSSTSTTSSGSKYCDLPPPRGAMYFTVWHILFFSSTHTCAERKFFF